MAWTPRPRAYRQDDPEIQAWLAKQMANRPERDDAWWERVMAIYNAPLTEAEREELRAREGEPPTD